jgi:hypothetical protein
VFARSNGISAVLIIETRINSRKITPSAIGKLVIRE